MSDKYTEIIKKLREITPVNPSAGLITETIMAKVESSQTKRYIFLNAGKKEWLMFNGLRTLTSVAAIFLIGFFIIQQRQINIKLARLEEKVATRPVEAVVQTRYEKAYDILQQSGIISTTDSSQKDLLLINRKSLNFMLMKIKDLEKENTGLLERFEELNMQTSPK